MLTELSDRLCASATLFDHEGRRPWASINFITSHDGFTLSDVVNEKHNETNCEGNRDGASNNRSWNWGVEGPTADVAIHLLRQRQIRNMLATLLVSQGMPMILADDEFARTQRTRILPGSSGSSQLSGTGIRSCDGIAF